MLSIKITLPITIKNVTLNITTLVTFILSVIMLSGANEPVIQSVITLNAIISVVMAPLIQP